MPLFILEYLNVLEALKIACAMEACRKLAGVQAQQKVNAGLTRVGIQRRSRAANQRIARAIRVRRQGGFRLAPKSAAKRAAHRSLRNAAAARKLVRLPLVAGATQLGRILHTAATAMPQAWQAICFGNRFRTYGSTADHDPDIYHNPPTNMQEETGLFIPSAAPAPTAAPAAPAAPAVHEVYEDDDEDGFTGLLPIAPQSVKAAEFVPERMVAQPAPTPVAAALPVPAFAVAPTITAPVVSPVVMPVVMPEVIVAPDAAELAKARKLEVVTYFHEACKQGLAGILSEGNPLKKDPKGLFLANPLAAVRCAIRAEQGVPYKLPRAVEVVIASGTRALVPEAIWPYLPGAYAINQAVATTTVEMTNFSTKSILCEASGTYNRGITKTGVTFNAIGLRADSPMAIKFGTVLGAIRLSNWAGKNEKVVLRGYQERDAKFLASLVTKCLLLAGEAVTVIVTEQVAEAINLFLESKAGKKLVVNAKFVGISNTWLMPVSGLTYEQVEYAFERIQVNIDQCYPGAAGTVPVYYSPSEDGLSFTVIVGGGTRFVINKGVNGRPPVVYHIGAGSRAKYRFRPFVATVPGIVGQVPVSAMVKLSSLDAFWYEMETYGFANLNRPHNNGKQRLTEAGKMVYISRFTTNEMPVECEVDLNTELSNRSRYSLGKYDICAVAMPLPFYVANSNGTLIVSPNGTEHAWQAGRTSSDANEITAYFNAMADASSVVKAKAPVLKMVHGLNELGLTLVPTGDVSEAVESHLVSIGFNSKLNQAKSRIKAVLRTFWDKEFAATFSALKDGVGSDLQFVEALWSKEEIAFLMRLQGITQHGAIGTQAVAFWQLVEDEFIVLLSNKQSKVVKRVAMTYSVSCQTKGERAVGYRTEDDQINKADLVRAFVAPNLKHVPGMGLLQEGAIVAYYPTRDQIGKAIVPGKGHVWIELVPELALIASEQRAMVGEDAELRGWEFADGLKVEPNTEIGTIMLHDPVRGNYAYSKLYAGTKGFLKNILFNQSIAFGGTVEFYTYATVKVAVVNSLKLRSAVALKLNVLPVKMPTYLGHQFVKGQTLNDAGFKNIEAFVYGDSYKGADNLTALVKLAGINLSYYADTQPEFRRVLIETNHQVQAFLGQDQWDNAEYLRVEEPAIACGIYREAIALFRASFETSVWHYERCVPADLATIRCAMTRNRAVAANIAAATPNSNLQGGIWRFVSSAEAKTIVSNGTGLSAALIFDIEALEYAGTYESPDLGLGNAYVVTNAPAGQPIGETDSISCLWSEEHQMSSKMGGKVVPHYCMLDRTYGWGYKDGLHLMYPVEVESIPVPQSIARTSVTSFSLVQFALEGRPELAAKHLINVRYNTHFDGLLRSMLESKHLVTAGVDQAIDLTLPEHRIAAAVFGGDPELFAQLTDPEVYVDDLHFFKILSKGCGNQVFRIPLSGGSMTLHLGTLYNWNKGSLRLEGDSTVKAVVAWFKSWIVRGIAPHDQECVGLANSAHKMLGAYYNGKGHMKSMLRGSDTVYIKAQACAHVPSDELWISWLDADHFKRVFGVEDLSEVTAVGFRRMPMFATNISKLRVLTRDECNAIKQEYGVWFTAGLAYMGVAQMYSNFGDLDGDAIEIGNMADEFNAGYCKHDNFDSIREMMNEVLGCDNLTYQYWLQPHADQYIADHFMVDSWSKFSRKSEVSWATNCTTRTKFENLQLSAGLVQTVTVGLTYRVASLMVMFAEILPKVAQQIVDLEGTVPSWLAAFKWTLDPTATRITIARLIQLYEVALGGYDKAMAIVTLGYLTRAMAGQTEIGWELPTDLQAELNAAQASDNFESVMPHLNGFRSFTHVGTGRVSAALEELGFSELDLPVFKDCFMLAGLCTDYSRNTETGKDLPVSLRLIFDIIQTVLDITQVKLNAGSDPIAFPNYLNTIDYAEQLAAEGHDAGRALLEVDQTIRTSTVSGRLFDAFYENHMLVAESMADGVTVFQAGILPQVS